MTTLSPDSRYGSLGLNPRLHRIPAERPWHWLAEGWQDFRRAPRVSLAYGGVIAFISLAIVATLNSVERLPLLLPMLAGFALVCPWLAVGLYAISRAISSGQTISVGMVASAVGRNGDQIGLMGIFLMLIHIVWVRIATLLFVLFFARVPLVSPGLSTCCCERRKASFFCCSEPQSEGCSQQSPSSFRLFRSLC